LGILINILDILGAGGLIVLSLWGLAWALSSLSSDMLRIPIFVVLGFLLFVNAVGVLLSVAMLVTSIMESVLVRQISFILGTALFLLSRSLMIRLTW
jgi:hypothetical protein